MTKSKTPEQKIKFTNRTEAWAFMKLCDEEGFEAGYPALTRFTYTVTVDCEGSGPRFERLCRLIETYSTGTMVSSLIESSI